MLINKITSTFGDHSNLLPLFTKDVVNSTGMTAFSYDAGGKIEAKDRSIDEFGTQAIWMGGLPGFKWIIDNTAYKLAKMNPDVDVRLLKDKEQLSVAQNYANSLKDKNFAKILADTAAHTKKAQGLFLGKFAAATALTLASFFTLVKVKQHYTKKEIEKQFWAKKSAELQYTNSLAQSPAFKAFMPANKANTSDSNKQNNKNVSFKGLGSVLSGVMFDPVKNLFIVDVGITGERLVNSRTKTEFAETAIKEGSLLFFLYVAGSYVQKGIEQFSEKLMGKPIGLHAEVLASSYMNKDIASGKADKDVNKVKELINNVKTAKQQYKTKQSDAAKESVKAAKKALYEYIYSAEAQENTVIKAAKHSGTIKTIVNGSWWQKLTGKAQNTHKIDPYQFIKIGDIDAVADNIAKLSKQASGQKDLTKFLKSCRNMKIASVAANMGITCLFLGLIVPYSMMKYREKHQDGKKEFHVQSEIEKQLEKSFKGRIA